jgi:NAD(P)-dependent dehydrogenase (short-subunit alcohol dehydrogenase family)
MTGKVALVTGAGGGIGTAICGKLQTHGVRVVATDVDEAALAILASNCQLLGTRRLDVTQPGDWQEVMQALQNSPGQLDILVNNAGIAQLGDVEDTTYETWQEIQRVDLDSVFLGSQAALPLLSKSAAGAIVNIASVSALVAGHNTAAYGAAKAGVRHLTRSIALHCARHKYPVRCNAVHPVFVDTAMLQNLTGGSDEMKDKMRRQIPMREFVTPDDVANAVLFLTSDNARMINGAELAIDGGLSAGV